MIGTTAKLAAIPATPHVDRRVALWSLVGFWAFYFVLNTARMAITGDGNQYEMMGRRAGVALVGIILSLVMYGVLRSLEGRSMRALLAAAFLVSVPASLAYAFVNFAAFYLIAPAGSMMHEMATMQAKHESILEVITDSAVSWYFFIAAWAVLYVALSYAAKVGHAERSAAAYRAQAQAAQLRALRYQINPHFLFNTLN